MKNIAVVMAFLSLVFLAAGSHAQTREAEEEEINPSNEERISLSIGQVPPAVMAVAKGVGPDVFFDKAERYWENDFRVYRISGRLFREVWNVYVRDDGKLLRKETDNQDR